MESYGSIATVRVVARSDKALPPQNNVRLLKAWGKVKKKLAQDKRFQELLYRAAFVIAMVAAGNERRRRADSFRH